MKEVMLNDIDILINKIDVSTVNNILCKQCRKS